MVAAATHEAVVPGCRNTLAGDNRARPGHFHFRESFLQSGACLRKLQTHFAMGLAVEELEAAISAPLRKAVMPTASRRLGVVSACEFQVSADGVMNLC